MSEAFKNKSFITKLSENESFIDLVIEAIRFSNLNLKIIVEDEKEPKNFNTNRNL